MNRNAKIALVAGVVILFIFLLYLFGGSGEKSYVSDDWSETYDPEDKGPYGTYMLKELLDTAGLFGDFLELDEELKNALDDDPDVNDIYFFVGRENFMGYESANYLHEFLQNGNTVFMSCESFPYDFTSRIAFDPNSIIRENPLSDSVQYFKFTHPELESKRYTSTFVYNNHTDQRKWNYFEDSAFFVTGADTTYTLGVNTKEQPNFVKIQVGKGLIYLHTTPYLFTNISLMKREGFQYAEKVLEHIPPGRIQWDYYNLNYGGDSGGNGDDGNGGGPPNRESVLQFILQHPPLYWALGVLLIGGLLYAIFKGKRMQKIIPAAELKENTSLGYITTLSSLYMQENKHHKLIKLKEKTFLNFIAEHYYISCKTPDDRFFEKVAVKSQVEKEKIEEIFKSFAALERVQNVTDEELILLHKKIEYFYKKCR